MDRVGKWVRAQLNRVLVVGTGLVLLPSIVVAERLRRGAGRRVAVRTIRAVAGACGVTFDIRGADRLSPGGRYVLVPNHSSPLDIPAMLAADPGLQFLAAAELFKIPLLAGAMRALGTEPVERRDPAAAYRQLAELADRGTAGRLVIFAEGGIPPAGERRPFKRGAFVLASETGAQLVPVAIHGTAAALPPRGRLAIRPGRVTVELLEPQAAPDPEGREAVRARVEAMVVARLAAGPG